jgi:hypothetical protein
MTEVCTTEEAREETRGILASDEEIAARARAAESVAAAVAVAKRGLADMGCIATPIYAGLCDYEADLHALAAWCRAAARHGATLDLRDHPGQCDLRTWDSLDSEVRRQAGLHDECARERAESAALYGEEFAFFASRGGAR